MRFAARRVPVGTVTLTLLALLSLPACKDTGEKSAQLSREHVEFLGALVTKDLGEVERGLPEGAKRGERVFAPAGTLDRDSATVKKGISRLQREVPDLLVAKSSFFAIADEKGIGIRNNLETDAMAGRDLFQVFPGLRKADEAPIAYDVGQFAEAASAPKKDRTWTAASAIRKDGKLLGYLVTGWSYRAFAHHLQETLLSDIKAKLLGQKDIGKLPVLYVAVFDAQGVYTDRLTPEVNEEILVEQHLVEKTAAGIASGIVKIDQRSFGFAAARTPNMGQNTGIAVLRSEI
jgi:hypothetical protein